MARADEPASQELARAIIEEHRGDAHREKRRVVWAEIEDEMPADGAEVVLVRGYISYQVVRMELRDGSVRAGSVTAARSWFYNQKNGESFEATTFDVDTGRFVTVWNAARRVLAARDERVGPAPDRGGRLGSSVSMSSHESVDWIRLRDGRNSEPLHRADRPRLVSDLQGVRRWDSLAERAVFELFEGALRSATERSAPVTPWCSFATRELRAACATPDATRLQEDRALLGTCLHLEGTFGDPASEAVVASFQRVLYEHAEPGYWTQKLREESRRAALRLLVRHHFDRRTVASLLREHEGGTWAREDQAKWLRTVFRERDPEGWSAFVLEEARRGNARAEDVAAATRGLAELDAEIASPLLRKLLGHADPTVRLEAALALHGIRPDDAESCRAVVALALDRSIECTWRPDLTDRWCRSRALDAALEWGGLTPRALLEHVLVPLEDDPEFLTAALSLLAETPHALGREEQVKCWRRLLKSERRRRVLAAVRRLVELGDGAMRADMLEALERLQRAEALGGEAEGGLGGGLIARWRDRVLELPVADEE